jgi:predicted DNA-binding protein
MERRRMSKRATILINVEPELKDTLQRLADADCRPLANYIREVVLRPHTTKVAKKKA